MPNQKDSKADIQGIIFPNEKLAAQEKEGFREVLQLWSILARRYANRWGWGQTEGTWEEVHWWYRERAHVGLFAAAVWLAGGVALEEYGSEKNTSGEEGPTKYKGRTDLCFSLRLPKLNYIVETKHVPAELPLRRTNKDKLKPILRGLEAACTDATKHGDEDTRLGIVFVTLDLPDRVTDPVIITKSIQSWTKAVQDDPELKKCLAISWFFPSEARLLLDVTTGKPGTAVFIAEVGNPK